MAKKKVTEEVQTCAVSGLPKAGYVLINKDTDPNVSFEAIKSALTFTTRETKKFGFGEQQTVHLYEELGESLLVPKRYAQKEFLNGQWQVSKGSPVDLGFDTILQASRPESKELQDGLIQTFFDSFGADTAQHRGGLFCAGCGCHARGTKICTAVGEAKNVEDIKVGDEIRGFTDNQTVVAVKRGVQEMVDIRLSSGETYRVNLGHIQSFYDSRLRVVVDMCIRDYIYVKERSPREVEGLYLFRSFVQGSIDELIRRFTIERTGDEEEYFGFTLSGDGRFVLPGGLVTHNSGKTVCGLKMASMLSKTTLVMVHKEFLMKQWVERIKQFLDIPPESIGIVQGTKCKFEGKRIVLGMIQSLAMREYTPDLYSYFGTILVDEAHRVSAPMFSQALPKFSAHNVIGLTATPRRGDGLEEVFQTLIGPVLSKAKSTTTVIPTIYQVGFNSYCPEQKYLKRSPKTGQVQKIYMAKLINMLSENKRRTHYIVNEMTKALAKGRRVLVFSDRLEHLKDLKEGLEVVMPTVTTGYYVGGMKPEEWEKSAQCDAIFSTYAMGKEGLDIPAMDTLYLATPKSDVEQAIGRVVRECLGKKNPVVVDVVDMNDTCEGFAEKRRFQYQKLGYPVKHI